jgi:signal transduction histidine kinase
VEASWILYPSWAVSTGLAVSAAWLSYSYLKTSQKVVFCSTRIREAVVQEADFGLCVRALCTIAQDELKCSGCTLYLQPGKGETGFRRVAEAGRSAEETGPGLVRDLLTQAFKSGKLMESQYGGRSLLAMPVRHSAHAAAVEEQRETGRTDSMVRAAKEIGGAFLVVWEGTQGATAHQKAILDIMAFHAAMLAPRFSGDNGALAKAQEEIQTLHAEMAEEQHLASVGRLAAGVAHELNTPLGAVLTMVSSLQRNESDANRARRLQIIRDAVEKSKTIIEKLLVYSREPVEAEHGLTFSRFVRSDSNLNAVIESTVELLRETLTADGVSVKLNLGELPPLRLNSTQFSHIFNNLIVNSRDALKSAKTPDAEIEITTHTEGENVKIEVSDNGPGIPDDVRKKVFQPFFTTKDIGKGTGLGLAIVSEVARKHGGSVTVGSGPKGGAKFVLTLPISLV